MNIIIFSSHFLDISQFTYLKVKQVAKDTLNNRNKQKMIVLVHLVVALHLPEDPHDSKNLSNSSHFILVFVAAPSHHLSPAPNTGGGQQTQDERGKVRQDPKKVNDVHTTLDEPAKENHQMLRVLCCLQQEKLSMTEQFHLS